MAKTSSSGATTPNTSGVDTRDLSYQVLVECGVDMDSLVSEHIAHSGVAGLRVLAQALNASRVERDPYAAIETLGALEVLKCSASAKQSDQVVAFENDTVGDKLARGIREKNPAWGVRGEVALALHLSPRRGVEFVNYSRILIEDLPRTLQGLREGMLTKAQSRVIVSGIRHLRAENRKMIDELLWEEPHKCFEAGDALLRDAVAYWALILEPATEEDLEAKALKNRYVGGYQINAHSVKISGMLPLEQGIPLMQVLAREIEHSLSTGDTRTGNQVAADTVFELMTGIKAGGSIPVNLCLVMAQKTFTAGGGEPVLVPGYGYLSAAKAREIFVGDRGDPLDAWVRRLWADPLTGELVSMESKGRRFSGSLKRFIGIRDQYCRTPYCNGRIEHLDHVVQVRKGGKTTAENASGRCASCNATKEAPGWEERPVDGLRHSLRISTPSGHGYTSSAPPLPGMLRCAGSGQVGKPPGTGPERA